MLNDLDRALAYFRPYAGQNGPSSLRADESRRHLAVIEAALAAATPLELRAAEHVTRERCAAVAEGHSAAMEGNPPTSGEKVALHIAEAIRAIDLTKPVEG